MQWPHLRLPHWDTGCAAWACSFSAPGTATKERAIWHLQRSAQLVAAAALPCSFFMAVKPEVNNVADAPFRRLAGCCYPIIWRGLSRPG